MAANFNHWKSHSRFLKKKSVHILTWNVSSKYPENLPIHVLLGLEENSEKDIHRPDIFVLGLQEINSQPQSMVKGLFKDDPWTQRFKELLNERGYVAIKSLQMQGLLLVVFTRRLHLPHVREIMRSYTRTGLGGIWGNKGAVSIRFKMYGVSVCMVNSHLAAHDHMLDERIQDFEKIVDEHKFHLKQTPDIFQHDYVFWFGDLNFRLTDEDELSPSDIKGLVKRDRLDELIARDQLSMIRRQGRAFARLEERLPAFPPTFKFELGTSNYDMKRRPAWCDRILYKTPQTAFKNMELVTEQTSYRSHPQFTISDHKPVTSDFTINVYKDPTEKTVELAPLHTWKIGEENTIKYTLPTGFDEASSDWIGIFKENFDSLDDYITYEYTSRSKAPSGDYPHDKVIYHLGFPDTIDLEEDERFQLLYFKSTKNMTSLVGISEPFKVEKRCVHQHALSRLIRFCRRCAHRQANAFRSITRFHSIIDKMHNFQNKFIFVVYL